MLFDPKWSEQKTVADPLSLDSLIAWLETQPPETKYEWMNCGGGCLIGQYFQAIFGDGHSKAGRRYEDVFRGHPDPLAYGRVCSRLSGPTTYGAALDRARKLRGSR